MTNFVRTITAITIALIAAAGARAADTYKLDPAHTSTGFTISHLVISEVSGRFNDVAGEVTLDKGALTGAKATIQVKSVDTANAKRDEHLRTPDFFDATQFPTITFESTKVEKDGDKTVLVGKFTMHGVTKEIRMPVVVKGPIEDPWKNTRIAISTEATVNRTDYGMQTMMGVGDDVKIKITAEAIKSSDEKK